MTALVAGTVVRHRHDGARSVVRGVEGGLGMYRVEFADGENLVPAEDLRLVRRGRSRGSDRGARR